MKKYILILTLFFGLSEAISQIAPDQAGYLMGLPQATDLTEIEAITNPQIGSIVYNLNDEDIYRYTGITNGWQKYAGIDTDDQDASEVPLVIDVDLNGTTLDPTPILEATVEEAIQAIAPITSKAGRVFYPPSIEIDASVISTGNETIDLYAQYESQFTLAVAESARSTGAPTTIPIYTAAELYYYVTYADPTVFDIIGIDAVGELTYQIVGIPDNDNTLINVVFVVK